MPEIREYPSLAAACAETADLIADLAGEAVRMRGRFTLALSGGKTPGPLYRLLGDPPFSFTIPWKQCHIFWGDERWVGPDHPQSNYLLAATTFLDRVPVPPENVHRVETSAPDPASAAREYHQTLARIFSQTPAREYPVFDLILLGLGTDGHTASLFPGSAALTSTDWVEAIPPPPRAKPAVARLTLTLPLLNQARCILFLATGTEKRELVHSIIADPDRAARRYPAARIQPRGRLIWALAP